MNFLKNFLEEKYFWFILPLLWKKSTFWFFKNCSEKEIYLLNLRLNHVPLEPDFMIHTHADKHKIYLFYFLPFPQKPDLQWHRRYTHEKKSTPKGGSRLGSFGSHLSSFFKKKLQISVDPMMTINTIINLK